MLPHRGELACLAGVQAGRKNFGGSIFRSPTIIISAVARRGSGRHRMLAQDSAAYNGEAAYSVTVSYHSNLCRDTKGVEYIHLLPQRVPRLVSCNASTNYI